MAHSLENKSHFHGAWEKPKLLEDGLYSKLARKPFPNERLDNKAKYA